jgi:hypothetical protein
VDVSKEECTVNSVSLDAETRRLAPQASAKMLATLGDTFTTATCIHLLEGFIRAGGPDTVLHFVAHRREGSSGIDITCEFKLAPARPESETQCDYTISISGGGIAPSSLGGGAGMDMKTHTFGPVSSEEYARELRDGLSRCLASLAGTPVMIDIRIHAIARFSNNVQ